MGLTISCGECREVSQQYVITVLHKPAIAYVDFTFGCLRVHSGTMRAIAALVGNGRIGTIADQERQVLAPGAGARYEIRNNLIRLGSFDASHVVHEAIHALQDGLRFPTKLTQAEATAYLGQMVFVVADEALMRGEAIDAVAQRWEGHHDAIRATATRVARRLGMFNRCFVNVSASDLAPIELAIAAHPVYQPKADSSLPFDGH